MSRKDIDIAFGDRIGITRRPGETDDALQMRIDNAKARAIERQEELDDLKHNAAVEKTKNEINEAKNEAERLKGGRANQQPQGFEVKGGVDFGTFNLQAMMAEAANARKDIENQMKEQLASTGKVNEQLRQELHQAQLRELETRLTIQIAQARSGEQPLSLTEKIEEIKQTAEAIGLNLGPHGTSETVNIQLQQLKQAHEMELEKMKDAREEANRRWELDKRRYDDEREDRKEQARAAARKYEMFTNFPQLVGATIVAAMRDAGNTVPDAGFVSKKETAAPAAAPSHQAHQKPGMHLELALEESGSFPCPECDEIMVIGPNATRAVCPECELVIPIQRVEASA